MKRLIIVITILGFILAIPDAVLAAKSPFHYSGWIPFWKQQSGANNMALHLEKLKSISPFSYEVKANGTFKDSLKIGEGFWPGYLSAVRDMGIKIIPTIAWFDGKGIHAMLIDTKKRRAHEDAITKLVVDKKFDGIDIDYESKLDKTNPYFALFIQGLAIRLHPRGKTLSCTIESRTPLDSLYEKIPDDITFANDYPTLNKYCDEVRIMAYDQGVIDRKLDRSKGNGKIYAPVADVDWVEKVITLASKTISPKKIMLGVPTYGYEYQISWANNKTTYERLRSHTYVQAMARAREMNAVPQRNSAGELSFTYTTSTWVTGVNPILHWLVSSTMPVALTTANTSTTVLRYVSFSDAESAAQKIALAKKYGLRGVVFFKFDGDQDPLLWGKMK